METGRACVPSGPSTPACKNVCRKSTAVFVDVNLTEYTGKRAAIPGPNARPRPGAPRLYGPRARLQARGRHRAPASLQGLAPPCRRHRPVRPHGGRPGAMRAHDRRHSGRRAGIGEAARPRGRKQSNAVIKNLIVKSDGFPLASSYLCDSPAFLGTRGSELQLFRSRTGNASLMYGAKEMLPLPRSLRSKSGNYRFSIPGNPCYYLSNSSYGCWIETGFPPEADLMLHL